MIFHERATSEGFMKGITYDFFLDFAQNIHMILYRLLVIALFGFTLSQFFHNGLI